MKEKVEDLVDQIEPTLRRILCYVYNNNGFLETGICNSTLICIRKVIGEV